MNNFSCSLSCTWMTIIDCLFNVSSEYIAKLLVAGLNLNLDLYKAFLATRPILYYYIVTLFNPL